MEITNITSARANLYKLAKVVIESHEPIVLSSKAGDIVMISKEDYESILETIYLHYNHGLAKQAKKLRNAPANKFVTRDKLPW